MMDRQGIASAILSLSALASSLETVARNLARRTNEFAASCVSDNSHRFGFFAVFPLPDVDDAPLELDYAMDTLHADGVILLSNYPRQYPDDPAFEPLFAEPNLCREPRACVYPG